MKGRDEVSVLIEVEIKGLPPSVNKMYGVSRHGKFKLGDVSKWQAQAVTEIQRKRTSRSVYTGDVELSIILYSNSRRRWDVDNRVKALQDCLQFAGVVENDAQVQKLTVERVYGNSEKTFVKVIKI